MKYASVVLLVTISIAVALGVAACVAPTDNQGAVEATVRAIVASTEQARNLQATISALETAQAEMKAPATATVTPPPGGGSATEPTKAPTAVAPTAVPTAIASPTSTPSPVPPPVTAKADLYVSEFALNPTIPTQGKPVAVRVGVYNKGNGAGRPVHGALVAGRELPHAGLRVAGRELGGEWRTHPDLRLRRLSQLVRQAEHQGRGRHGCDGGRER